MWNLRRTLEFTRRGYTARAMEAIAFFKEKPFNWKCFRGEVLQNLISLQEASGVAEILVFKDFEEGIAKSSRKFLKHIEYIT